MIRTHHQPNVAIVGQARRPLGQPRQDSCRDDCASDHHKLWKVAAYACTSGTILENVRHPEEELLKLILETRESRSAEVSAVKRMKSKV